MAFMYPGLDIPLDLNSDDVYDVCFIKTAPANPISGVTNPQRLSNDTYGELHWLDNIPREWADYKYLYPIPLTDVQQNPALTQNPGWQ